ncbi:hypothetical protein CXB51_004004 [Gossypium anomalum]|uniref:Uncharacterized protein n=1 Tax=Gossypium anomalum TaxID=47600 RepID=A0A8J6A0Y1_9ROSI|nr:hypothetical protein CXB51_004004 [Gossypium anomalum]
MDNTNSMFGWMELLFHSCPIPCATVIHTFGSPFRYSAVRALNCYSTHTPNTFSDFGTKIACFLLPKILLQISSNLFPQIKHPSIRLSSSSPQRYVFFFFYLNPTAPLSQPLLLALPLATFIPPLFHVSQLKSPVPPFFSIASVLFMRSV